MAKGRPPKTTDDHKRDGTYDPSRHSDRKEFALLKHIPDAPFTDQRRVKYWDHFCGKLITTGILTIQHLDSIEALCSLKSDLDDLNEQVRIEGATFKTDSGQIKANPAYTLKLQTQAQIIRLFEQFGFTPRTSMTLKAPNVKEKEKDPFEELLSMTAAIESSKPKDKRPKA